MLGADDAFNGFDVVLAAGVTGALLSPHQPSGGAPCAWRNSPNLSVEILYDWQADSGD